jgi:DNA-binding GntR family transcriptional regulator
VDWVTQEPNDAGRWSFDRKLPLSEQIYRDLRKRIVLLEISPNQSLDRGKLAAYYGISQTPLRDALLKLEREGLVEIYPQSRTLVTRIDTRSVRETQFLRTAVEVEVVKLIASMEDRSALSEAADLVEQQRIVFERDGRFQEFARLDKLFHQQLFLIADKMSLYELIDERSGQLDRVRQFHLHLPREGKMRSVLRDHQKILGALQAGDADLAAEATRQHLAGTVQKLELLQERHPEAFV